MKTTPSAAQVAFVIKMQTRGTAADVARIQHVIHLFRGHRITCTWSVAGCCSLESVQQKGILNSTENLAIAIGSECVAPRTSASMFRENLRKRLAAMQACSGADIHLVAGDPTALRPYAAILVEQGIRGVLSNETCGSSTSSQTPLPCGLWQMNFHAEIPRRKSLFSYLTVNQSVQRKIGKLTAADQPLLISINASAVAHASARYLQQLDKLLQSVSHLASRQQLQIVTINEIVADLLASRISRPQQSILRAA